MPSNKPIGVIDSGAGGLSVLKKIQELMPNEELLYLADSYFAPYGPRSKRVIKNRCFENMGFIELQHSKALVLACNTATAAGVEALREEYDIPIIGMEPAIKPAADLTRTGVVGVLATEGTLDSEKFMDLESLYKDKVEIITKACHGLVDEIEKLKIDQGEIVKLVTEYTEDFLKRGGDTLVLGCTHYALIVDIIAEIVGPEVVVVDTGMAVAKELKRRLQSEGLETDSKQKGRISFFTSGNTEDQQVLLSRYWGEKVPVLHYLNFLLTI
ncbi:MAG: glutamate racemase [Gammaproteobacteria bacterium]|jgi:glutamate racemase|nr:glutamate racemase [Kordiimonadaceae bacterium]MDG2090864.1 glutamate racemase [Gammaproteobacteria bacterium]